MQWLWVTNGLKLENVNPGDTGLLWSCHKKTIPGELALMYGSSKPETSKKIPKSAFCFLVRTTTKAHVRTYWQKKHPDWNYEYGCECEVFYKFVNPLTFKELGKSDFRKWKAFRKGFQGGSHEIPNGYWKKLNQLIENKNPGYHMW